MPRRLPAAACLALLLALPAQAQKPDGAPPESGLVSVPGFPAAGIPGQAASDNFGRSVASAGDVDGDGYDDLIAGAPNNDAGGTGAGRATVHFGGPGGGVLTLTGETAGDSFGYSVAGAGDVNGDGYHDVIVGAYNNDAGGSNAGRAYIYFGGPTADAVPDLVLTGEAADDNFGASVAGAGDVNGDGYGDVIIGALANDAGGANAGRATIFFGGPAADATPDLVFTGEAAGDEFGDAVASAGDVNGDGYGDLIVGATGNDAGGSNAGRAYVYFGGPTADAVPDLTLTGAAASDAFGFSVAGIGDVNGDSYDDLIVGAPLNDAGGSNAGRATIFFGGPSADATPDLTFTGEAASDNFGRSVAGAGDVNGDGFADFIVGAYLNDAGGSNAGRAYVFFGGPTADSTPDVVLTGASAGDQFGVSVASAGDLNGDGLPDLVVGAPSADPPNGSNAGAVYVYSNANTGAGVAVWSAFGEAASDGLGRSVASAGDVNGDGYDDLIVGAPNNGAGGSNAGRAYVYFGGPAASATPDLILTGMAAGDRFGYSVAGSGDVNGDGYDDMIVGAYNNDAGGVDAGRAYVYFGGPAADAVPDMILTGAAAGDHFGYAVAGAGDQNGDGYADIIVGAPGYISDRGRIHVFYGGATPDAVSDRAFLGQEVGDHFGSSVAGVGDVNGDGYDDVIVGAWGNDSGGSNAGRAYVFFGASSLPGSVASLQITGAAEGDLFGSSVATAGDVNGDGYDDFVVGAYGNDAGGTQAGRVYVYFGSADPDTAPDLTLTGSRTGDSFGYSVAGAGDVNGDGYADLIVGASNTSTISPSAGSAYIFFGGLAPDEVPAQSMFGRLGVLRFGGSVASAGDVNGDGRADVLVGVDGANNGGEAHLYSATGPAASPGFTRLADVPGDQGGVIAADWTRSDRETQGDVTGYLVQRSRPAGSGGYAWEPVATVPGTMERRYSLAVPTYSNQTGTNPGTTCVRVTALGADGELWRSTVRCAASIDNLAPDAPPSLAVAESPTGDALVSVAPLATPPADLAGYAVYRSADNTCDPADPFVGLATDLLAPALDDDATSFGSDVWYCATARDVHGNESAFVGAASANPAVLAAVKVVLQGAYQAGLPGGALMRTDLEDFLPIAQPYAAAPWSYAGTEAIPATDADDNGRPDLLDAHAVVDWVLVEIRTSPTDAVPTRAAALLLADGTLLDPATASSSARVRPAAPGAYHVAITHRSHLAAMSVFSIGLSSVTANAAFDFTLSPSLVYGSNAVAPLGGGVYGLYAGDGDGSGSVLAGDRQTVWLPQVGQTGYLPGDFNLSGTVLADDRQTLWAPNVGRQSAVPGASLRTEPHQSANR